MSLVFTNDLYFCKSQRDVTFFLSQINSNARSQNICTFFTRVVHWYEITLKSVVFQSAGVARGSCKVFQGFLCVVFSVDLCVSSVR